MGAGHYHRPIQRTPLRWSQRRNTPVGDWKLTTTGRRECTGSLPSPLSILCELLHGRLGTAHEFIPRNVLDVRCDCPNMSEGIFQGSAAVPIKLVLNGLLLDSSGG